ncbi:hypothetical protein LOTGIDRAFT_165221 [Lottia gigantea]|uniref:Uncharacterized protein n=1 Tax=Lottia gigantea TaxID=225164 RepID=V4A699_LOTGI|nr:hypothetical protein LOTGIDRAFT_165221 [Lottia gigantea]ESO88806.1 hypothetical protein LOTGIDRAFT_165221 [Lottia gigantea]
MEAPHDTMNKKTMMKRQCMYFPVDDYVTLSPIPLACEGNRSTTTVSPANISDNVFEKQLSPMTISSGYDSDYSPPWPSDMDKIFAKMVETVCSNQDDSHTDYFSQSETYPRSVDVQEKCFLNPEGNAQGPNKLSNPNNAGYIDGYDISERSRTRCISEEKTVLGNGPYHVTSQTISDLNYKSSRICFDKYLLNRGSVSCLDQGLKQRSSLESGSTVSLDNLKTKKDATLLGTKLVNGARRSKRYRFDANRDSLCKLNVESASNSELSKTFGDFEMQTTCSNVTSPRITPIDFFGLFKKSPTPNNCVETISNNTSNRISDQVDLNEVKTNAGHTIVNNSVGDLSIDNIQPLKQNGDNLRCVKSPRGRLDTSDYEHIYDVIPGDEHVLSQSKFPSMATQLVRNKWSTLDDVRRPRNILNANPPALPVRSYLKDKGSNCTGSISNMRVVCSSVDDLYARVNKREDKIDQTYATSVKYKPQISDISNKENVLSGYNDDYDYLSSETYCRIGSCMEEKVTNWSSGDVLNFIDGIKQPEPKCRENIYGLLSSRQVRAKLSESLEIENKLVTMGLLKNSWSCDNVETEEKPPIPPRAPLNTFRPIYV